MIHSHFDTDEIVDILTVEIWIYRIKAAGRMDAAAYSITMEIGFRSSRQIFNFRKSVL